MAIRKTTHVLKNSDIVGRPLPSSLKAGEPIVNTADGIMYFSGVTTSSTEWTPAGTGTTANFFEVGSNLYDLQLRNRITEYEGASGAGLVGKFLSGTTNGFELADISSITGVDSYVTGGTFNNTTDTLTLNLNEGKPNVNIGGFTDYFTTGSTLIGSVAYFDRNDTLSAFTLDLSTFITTGDTYTTGFTYDGANNLTIERNQGLGDLSVNINTMTGLTVTGTISATTIDAADILSGGTNILDIFSDAANDTYVTGGTVSISATDNSNVGTIGLFYKNSDGSPYTLPFEDTFITGGTLNGTNLELDKNDGVTETIDLSALSDVDTKVTAFTYDNANTFTISNSDATTFDATINTVTGMTNTGNLDLQGELANSTGNVVINDNLDITGTTTSWGNILPGAHLTYDLGAVGQRWDELWVRKVRIGTTTTTLEDDGANFTMSGTNGNFIFRPTVDMEVHADIVPDADLTRDLGEVANRWNNVYAGDISATGLTIAGLGTGRVVYTNGSGALTTESGFEYNDGTDTLLAGNINTSAAGSAFVGTGGLIVGTGGNLTNPGIGDVVIHGNLTVFGDAITASTGELYIEDNNITLNYNPTGDTSASSVGAGFTIQDGDGAGGDVKFDIRAMNGFTGLTGTDIPDITEYSGPTGVTNRAFVTPLNDLVIRSTSQTTPNGVRVLAEFDCLDGGTF